MKKRLSGSFRETLHGFRFLDDNLAVESIRFGDGPVEVSSTVKHPGVWPDNTLDMKKFIPDRCRIASLRLCQIRIIKKYLSHGSFLRLINASVPSHLVCLLFSHLSLIQFLFSI